MIEFFGIEWQICGNARHLAENSEPVDRDNAWAIGSVSNFSNDALEASGHRRHRCCRPIEGIADTLLILSTLNARPQKYEID